MSSGVLEGWSIGVLGCWRSHLCADLGGDLTAKLPLIGSTRRTPFAALSRRTEFAGKMALGLPN